MSWRDSENNVHITSFTIGEVDAPLHRRQFRVPNTGNCCLVRLDTKISVTCIIAVVELILQSICPVCQSIDAPLQDSVKRRWRFLIFRKTDLFPYIGTSRASSDYFTFICVQKHRPVVVLDILDGVYSRRKSHVSGYPTDLDDGVFVQVIAFHSTVKTKSKQCFYTLQAKVET